MGIAATLGVGSRIGYRFEVADTEAETERVGRTHEKRNLLAAGACCAWWCRHRLRRLVRRSPCGCCKGRRRWRTRAQRHWRTNAADTLAPAAP